MAFSIKKLLIVILSLYRVRSPLLTTSRLIFLLAT